MAETIYRGYLINKYPYQIFDEVVTFLIGNGCRIACLSKGSRKISSKNARHLFLGAYTEFEIFQSRHDDKLSRLKKVTTIDPINWNYEILTSFNLLNECTLKANINRKTLFDFYHLNLELIVKKGYNEKLLILIILEQFINLLGHNLAVNYCIKCHNRKLKTVSFKDHGMLCNLCFDPQKDKYYELDVSKTIHYLFNREYDELNKYYQCFDFVIKLLRLYIDDNSGIKLQSLQNY